jgi:hypothetical protein
MPTGIYDRKPGKGARWILAHIDYCGADCLPWPYAKFSDGYGVLGYQGARYRAHVLMCTLTHGPAPSPEHEAAHNCGNGHLACCNQTHLRWKTRSENQHDRATHNRRPLNGKPRLKPDQVREIRQLKGELTQQAIADRFGTSRTNIIMIHNGTTWPLDEKGKS